MTFFPYTFYLCGSSLGQRGTHTNKKMGGGREEGGRTICTPWHGVNLVRIWSELVRFGQNWSDLVRI